MLTSFMEVCQQLGLLTINLEDGIILDVIDDIILTQERCPVSFLFISLIEVCQEWGSGRGYLDHIEGYLSETWKTGSS